MTPSLSKRIIVLYLLWQLHEIAEDEKDFDRLVKLEQFSAEKERDDLQVRIQRGESELMAAQAQAEGTIARINQLEWLNDRNEVVAAFDCATGSAWISANKPHPALGFMDIIGGGTVRLKSLKAYFSAI